mmetsp:Transcript_31280/g.63792  ORF Transcript_31280/g.63792 Transcript_31280/m.63792 type:complete len:95 (+) Transcript_31280:2262-2546(+)
MSSLPVFPSLSAEVHFLDKVGVMLLCCVSTMFNMMQEKMEAANCDDDKVILWSRLKVFVPVFLDNTIDGANRSLFDLGAKINRVEVLRFKTFQY